MKWLCISDIHIGADSSNKSNYEIENIPRLLDLIKKEDIRLVSINGDTTQDCTQNEFENFKKMYYSLGQYSELCVNLGNHDTYGPEPYVENFLKTLYSDTKYVKEYNGIYFFFCGIKPDINWLNEQFINYGIVKQANYSYIKSSVSGRYISMFIENGNNYFKWLSDISFATKFEIDKINKYVKVYQQDIYFTYETNDNNDGFAWIVGKPLNNQIDNQHFELDSDNKFIYSGTINNNLHHSKFITSNSHLDLESEKIHMWVDRNGSYFLQIPILSTTKDPIFIAFHFNLTGSFSEWWSNDEKIALYNSIVDKNILAIHVGHYHIDQIGSWSPAGQTKKIKYIMAAGNKIGSCVYDKTTKVFTATLI